MTLIRSLLFMVLRQEAIGIAQSLFPQQPRQLDLGFLDWLQSIDSLLSSDLDS